jgi:ATP-dependent Lon protease
MASNPKVELVSIPSVLPVLPLRDMVVFPEMAAPVMVGQPRSLELVRDAMKGNRMVVVVAQKNPASAPAQPDDLYGIGTAGLLHELGRTDNAIHLVVQGVARIQPAFEPAEQSVEVDALVRTAKDLFGRFVRSAAELSDELATAAEKMTDARQLAYVIASAVPLPTRGRQELLEMDLVSDRLRRLVQALQHELAVRDVVQRIRTETAEELTKAQREQILRMQMEAIQRALGELEGRTDGRATRERLESLPMPEEARKEAMRELERLERTPEASPEHGIIHTYLDWILKLPWGRATGTSIDVEHARQVLDEDHYDLDKIKDRLLDYLAAKHLREERRRGEAADGPGPGAGGRNDALEAREPILCLLGPPGVGKTSLGQSIARALGRTFVHQSLGGVHDEAEIRGHRRTYIGAMPGRIIQALARAGTADPVFVLDEVDKLGAGFQGDPSAALLELLDPAQNHAFVDTYLGVPFDLSRVLFICTANTTDTIPAPLLDRMEVLSLAGYTEREKLQIAGRFLVPGQRAANGLREGEVILPEETILAIVRGYTREAGVRSLEREIGAVMRKAARRITQGAAAPMHVHPDELREYLGRRRFFEETGERIDRPGVAAGLSWTPAGGDVLFVEATMVRSAEERLVLTGMLGNVMRESAQAALTYLWANAEAMGIDPHELEQRRTVHIHVPAGAIPKDGPSAGVAMLAALASAATARPLRGGVAMTGEITLRGKVLPVGGIKEKVLAAHRAGLDTVILPRRNEGDLDDVPPEVRMALRFALVDSVDEVLHEALGAPREPAPPAELAPPPPVH